MFLIALVFGKMKPIMNTIINFQKHFNAYTLIIQREIKPMAICAF